MPACYAQNDTLKTNIDSSKDSQYSYKSLKKDIKDDFSDIASSFGLKDKRIYCSVLNGYSTLSDGSYVITEHELKSGFLVGVEQSFRDFPFNVSIDFSYKKKGDYGRIIFDNVGISPRVSLEILQFFVIKGGYNFEANFNNKIYPNSFYNNSSFKTFNHGIHFEAGLQIPMYANHIIYLAGFKDWGRTRVFSFDLFQPIRSKHVELKDYFLGFQIGYKYIIGRKKK